MFDRYHDSWLITLGLLCLGAGLWSWFDHAQEPVSDNMESELAALGVSRESYFKEVACHSVKGDWRRIFIESKELMRNTQSQRTIFFEPRGEVASHSGAPPLLLSAGRGVLQEHGQWLRLESKVRLAREGVSLRGAKAVYHFDKEEAQLEGDVQGKALSPQSGDTILLWSDQAHLWPVAKKSRYTGRVRGQLVRHRKYERGLKFRADELSMDLVRLHLGLVGKVAVIRPRVLARGRRGEIFLENYNKKLKYFVIYDDVKVTERVERGPGAPYERRAWAERLEGLPRENKIILSGYPRVSQQGDVIRGNRITLRENTELVEVDDANTNFFLSR